MTAGRIGIEPPTLLALLICYGIWLGALFWLDGPAAVAVLALCIAFHSSLQHETIHGHPTPWPWLNAASVWPALGLLVPYARFRDTHLAHHQDARLTDPYDDPESNYLDPDDWARLSAPVQAVLRCNNTLLGRLLLGPLVSQVSFMAGDLAAIRRGDAGVLAGWLRHLPAAGAVLALVILSPLPVGSYLAAAYLGNALTKIRTFAEHRAHAHSAARSVVIEDRGPLALLFLNNNLHAVHHLHPAVPWYRLPRLYRANKARYLGRNGGYVFRSYWEIFARYGLRRKDPVPHPLWRRGA